jgi:heme A synthase
MPDKLSSEGLKAAADTTKQIITLATGVIALTVTFLEKIVQPQSGSAGRIVPWTMFAAWVLFGLAILAAVITLGAVTGTLDAIDRKMNGIRKLR